MEYFRHGPYLDVEFEDDPPLGAKHVKAQLLNGVEDMLSFTSAELNGRLSDGELSATFATSEEVQTYAYGTNLEATDLVLSGWVPDTSTLTGQQLARTFANKAGLSTASALAASTPAFAPATAGVPIESTGVMQIPPGGTTNDSLLIRPPELVPRDGRVLNTGANPFEVAYGNHDGRNNWNKPDVGFTTINPGEEWVEAAETRPLWVRSALGSEATYHFEIGADVA